MKCQKCFHLIPDDSEFCQYCGSRIEDESPSDIDTNGDQSSGQNDPNSDAIPEEQTEKNADQAFFELCAKAIGDNIVSNMKNQPERENDPDFGLVPEKPIYTSAMKLVEGETEYLKKLRTASGDKIKWSRIGSTHAEGVSGVIDAYDTFLLSGEQYKTIYINMYGAKESQRAPSGFVLSSNNIIQENIKRKYCKHCGTEITGIKKCPNCLSQRQKQKNKHKLSRAQSVSVLLIVLLLIGNITQSIFLFKNNKKNHDLSAELLSSKSLLEEANNSIKSLKESNDKYYIGSTRYFDILYACLKGNIGYSSNDFYADKSIIALSKTNSSSLESRITLFAKFNANVTISKTQTGNSVYVSFDEDSWYGSSTTLSVTPKTEGISTVTFSNSINNDSFSIIFIVY